VWSLALAIATIDINDGAKIEREHRAESLARAEYALFFCQFLSYPYRL
jgi:hypothetical protein